MTRPQVRQNMRQIEANEQAASDRINTPCFVKAIIMQPSILQQKRHYQQESSVTICHGHGERM